MKFRFFPFLVLFLSCNSSDSPDEKEDSDQDSTIVILDSNSKELTDTLETARALYIWSVDGETKTKTKNPQPANEKITVEAVIKGLNEVHPSIPLSEIKMGHDTLFTEIKDSEYLGELIGSTGADMYIADVILNLTSVSGVKYVKIDFAPGSHATPGTWSAADFADYKTVIK